MEANQRLTVIGGFVKPPVAAPHGSWQAAFRLCNAIARTRRFASIDVFHEDVERLRRGNQVVLPTAVPSRLLERSQLQDAAGAYAAIYVANGEQMYYAPHVLRADADLAPVVCEIGTAHHAGQWKNLFLAALGGALRPTDGFIFKARAVEAMYRKVWQDWEQDWASPTRPLPFPTSTVIPNGIDLAAHTRNNRLRADTRRELGLAPHNVVFLSFSRLSNGTKGDYRALLFSFGRLIERWPGAVLVLSGKGYDRGFLLRLRADARQAGLGNHLIVADNPYEVWPDARERLMSAADVFVHLSTGAEEVAPQSVLEAMACGLPIIAAHWAGLPEMVEDGGNGFLIPTFLGEPPLPLQRTQLAREESLANVELGRCVGCDSEAFVRAAALLLGDEPMRLAMGRQSRQRAEGRFALDQVAARRVAFFDELSGPARRAGEPGEGRPVHNLVSLHTVLWGMGQRPLLATDVIELGRSDGFNLLRAAPDHGGDMLDLIECVLRETCPLTAGELTRRVGAMITTVTSADDGQAALWSACSCALVRLIGYGAVRVAPGM